MRGQFFLLNTALRADETLLEYGRDCARGKILSGTLDPNRRLRCPCFFSGGKAAGSRKDIPRLPRFRAGWRTTFSILVLRPGGLRANAQGVAAGRRLWAACKFVPHCYARGGIFLGKCWFGGAPPSGRGGLLAPPWGVPEPARKRCHNGELPILPEKSARRKVRFPDV